MRAFTAVFDDGLACNGEHAAAMVLVLKHRLANVVINPVELCAHTRDCLCKRLTPLLFSAGSYPSQPADKTGNASFVPNNDVYELYVHDDPGPSRGSAKSLPQTKAFRVVWFVPGSEALSPTIGRIRVQM